MYGASGITKGLSLTKIIGGLSKTLQIANQVIPLYQKARPMIQNARNMMGILKEFTKNNSKGIEEANATIVNTKKEIAPNQKKEVVSTTPTSPTFFL